jgi:hypothetical protein
MLMVKYLPDPSIMLLFGPIPTTTASVQNAVATALGQTNLADNAQ